MSEHTHEQEEVWKTIEWTNGAYAISSLGRVKRIKPASGTNAHRLMKPQLGKNGYYVVNLTFDGKTIGRACVHVLVAEAFLGSRPEGACVNHMDGNKAHSALSNLEWTTHAGNMKHAATIGLISSGETRYNAKLTNEIVREAKSRYVRGIVRIKDLAAEYGVARHTLSKAIRGLTWKGSTAILFLGLGVSAQAQDVPQLSANEIREGAVRVEQLILSWERERLLRDAIRRQEDLANRERELAARELATSQKETAIAVDEAAAERKRAEEFKALYERASKKQGGFKCFLGRLIFRPCKA